MTDAYKKRANAGPTIGERKQEEFCPEKHGNMTTRKAHEPRWMKMQCGRCGFLLGFELDSSFHGYRSLARECAGCHRKRHS